MYDNERNEFEETRNSGYSQEPAPAEPVTSQGQRQAQPYAQQPETAYGGQQDSAYGSQQENAYGGQPAAAGSGSQGQSGAAYGSQSGTSYGGQQDTVSGSQQGVASGNPQSQPGASYEAQQNPAYGASQSSHEAQQGPVYGASRNSYDAQQEPPYSRVNMSHIPQEPEKKPKKKGSMAGKIAGVTAAAMLFGAVAGGTMFGVNHVGEYLAGRAEQETETEAQVSVKTAENDTQSGTESSVPAAADAAPAVMLDVSAIVEKAMPSVVAINSTTVMERQTWFGQTQEMEVPSSGSGIIVGQNDDELLIVTNNHVVADSKELAVTFIDDFYTNASIKGTDSESDLAVIAVPLKDIPDDTMSKISIATIGDSDALKVGQGVIAIGNALGYGQSVTVGYVSALDREVKADDQTTRNLLQTDAAINPGNSGGALLNMRGEVIGINAAKYSSTDVEGMGYAIPISKAQDIINELMNKKTRVEVAADKQGYLGIQGQNIDETAAMMYGMPRGIYVYKITEDSAAANSDLREKDIITKFDGQTVRTMADLKEMLTYYEGGTTVTLTVQSLDNGEYQERTVEITLGYKPAAETN